MERNETLNRMNEIQHILKQNSHRIQELQQVPAVLEYIKLSKENKKLYEEANKLQEEYIESKQNTCSHLIWYYLGDNTDFYEMRSSCVCKCLECQKIEENHPRRFKRIIKTREKRIQLESEVLEYYNELKNLNILKDSEIYDRIKERYNDYPKIKVKKS